MISYYSVCPRVPGNPFCFYGQDIVSITSHPVVSMDRLTLDVVMRISTM